MYIHSVVDYHEKKKNKINSQKGSLSSGLTSTGSNFTFLLFCELRNVSIFISKTFHSFWMCFLKESFNFSILFPFVFFFGFLQSIFALFLFFFGFLFSFVIYCCCYCCFFLWWGKKNWKTIRKATKRMKNGQ